MDRKEQYFKFITKNVIITVLFFVSVPFWGNFFFDWYDAQLVIPIFSKIPVNIYCDCGLLLLILFCFFLLFIFICRNTRVPRAAINCFGAFFLFFFYFRFLSNRYYFLATASHPQIYYIDFFTIIFLCAGLLVLANRSISFTSPNYNNDPFLVDSPILSKNQDLFNREDFAKNLAIKIQSKLENRNGKSLAIGICGPWGSGKSSFINMVKENIDTQNRMIIVFNPWRSTSPAKIIEDFFELLISQLGKHDPNLSHSLSKYASSLTKIDENILTKSLEIFNDIILGTNNKNETYDEINSSISNIKKQILIFIDDLDRLDKKEIIEVLRLVRNTADFANIVYIVSYDKEYVLEGIKDFNAYNYKLFLEKIFQYEFLLPNYDIAIIRNQLKEILQKKLPPELYQIIESTVEYSSSSGKNFTNHFIKTHRDVIRLCNSLLFDIEKIKHEVNFADFYLIQLIKLKFTDIYKFISDNRDIIFYKEDDKVRLRKTIERNTNDIGFEAQFYRDRKKGDIQDAKETILEVYIKQLYVTEETKYVILELFDELLDRRYNSGPFFKASEPIDYRAFAYVSNFNKYFNIQLLKTDFSSNEFETYRLGDFTLYKQKLYKWIDEGKLSNAKDNLEKITTFSTKEQWINHLKILLLIAKHFIENSGSRGINYEQLYNVLRYPVSTPKQLIFFNTEEEYSNWVESFFAKADVPYLVESNLLVFIIDKYKEFTLTNEKIEAQLLTYFKKYCDNNSEITTEFRELHRNCIRDKRSNLDQLEAQNIFTDYFKKNLTAENLAGFIQHSQPEKKYFNINTEWLQTFFPTMLEFEDYLNYDEKLREQKNEYEEFIQFYTLAKANNYKPIVFEFSYLKPNLWR